MVQLARFKSKKNEEVVMSARDVEVTRQMQKQGVARNQLQGPLGDEIRAELHEVSEQLTQRGKMSGAAKTPEALRDYLREVLTARVARLSDDEVTQQARYYALTDPSDC